MSDAERIARALDGKANRGGFICRCPVRSHGKGRGDRSRSLCIKDGDSALLVKCFTGCDPLDILDELRRRNLIEEHDENKQKRRKTAPKSRAPPPEPNPDPEALRIWVAACSPLGTIGEIYLTQHRHLGPPFPPSIRFAYIFHEASGIERPAIVAAVQRPDRKIIAVQVTYLTECGAKLTGNTPRLTFGSLGTGAVRLAAATQELGLGEGTETAWSAMGLTRIPCWATLGAWRMPQITVPGSVKVIHLFCDNDPSGRMAAEKAAERYTREGKRVYVRFPPAEFNDYNDLLIARAGASEAA